MGREVLQPHAASDRLGLGAVCWRVRQPWKLCRWNILVGPVLGSSWTSVPFYFQINGSGYPLRLEKYKRECGAWRSAERKWPLPLLSWRMPSSVPRARHAGPREELWRVKSLWPVPCVPVGSSDPGDVSPGPIPARAAGPPADTLR